MAGALIFQWTLNKQILNSKLTVKYTLFVVLDLL